MKAAAAVAVALIGASCGSHPPDMTACIPPGTIAIASLDLDRLRSAPIYAKLPQSVLAFADAYRDAHQLLLAWSGTDLLIIARGSVPGGTTVAPNLTVTGSPDSIRAAIAQYGTGKPGVPTLLDYAKKTAGGVPLWIAIQGGISLPLTGNTRNLNRLLRDLDYATAAATLDSAITLRLTAQSRSAEGANQFDQNLRAILSLASAAEARNASLATLLNSVQIHRDTLTTRATLTIPGAAVNTLLQPLNRTF